jgi:hypothetical protein
MRTSSIGGAVQHAGVQPAGARRRVIAQRDAERITLEEGVCRGVIGESIGIPPHLSLPGRSLPASVFAHDYHALGHIEHARRPTSDEGEKGNDDTGNALRRGRIRSAEERHMCPACIASAAVMVAGAGSTGGILAGVHRQVRKISQSESSRSVSEDKGEIRWQQAKRETRNTGQGISR